MVFRKCFPCLLIFWSILFGSIMNLSGTLNMVAKWRSFLLPVTKTYLQNTMKCTDFSNSEAGGEDKLHLLCASAGLSHQSTSLST